MTYEDAAEGEFLKSLFAGRSNNLENTVFAMLGPQGKTRLTRTGRSPGFAFGRGDHAAASMARAMDRYAKRYARTRETPVAAATAAAKAAALALPTIAGLRLALNVAACDDLPLVIVFQQDPAQRQRMQTNLKDVVWTDKLVGRAVYVVVSDPTELALIAQLKQDPKPGIHVVRPSNYGDRGRILASITPDSSGSKLGSEIDAAIVKYKPRHKRRGDHTATGREIGLKWQTRIPITDSNATGRSRRRSADGRQRRR